MNTAAAMATGGRSSVFLTVAPPPSQKLQTLSPKQVSFTNNKWSTLPLSHGNSLLEFNSFLCSSSSSTPVVEEKENGSSDDVLPSSINQESTSVLPPGACKGCGKMEIESGCNGEGRIQGGIATVPGFGWWPIKAYRPCPAFVACGGRYKRFGQSMDEVVSGKGGKVRSVGTDAEVQSSRKTIFGSNTLLQHSTDCLSKHSLNDIKSYSIPSKFASTSISLHSSSSLSFIIET